MSFVFFDTETTGLKRGFDQILHFAAVRTDENLNEVARFETRSRLQPHVLPHPSALRTNGLPIESLTDSSLPSHYTMVGDIRRTLISWSPAVFVGFNSIRFDEEMLRHALFQCLYPAYLTSNHRNCRADALSLVMAADAVSPAQLVVPVSEEGRRTFRLQQLAAANGVAHARAHDAMSDVLATLELSRLVYRRSPELWQRFVRFSNKATVADFIEVEDGFVLTEFFGGQAYHTSVVCIGRDPDQANGRLCLSLNEDMGRLAAMSDLELQVHRTQKPSPIRRFRINAAPTLTAFYDAPEHMLDGGSMGATGDRACLMKADTGLCARLVAAYMAAREPYALSPHLEERIYSGFPGPADEARIAAFHDARWEDRLAIVQGMEDERLRWFGLRLIYFEARSVLPEPTRLEVERYLTDQMTGDGSGCLTIDQAMAETERVLGEFASPDDLLIQYRTYLQDRLARLEAYRTRLIA
ncbi:MULTISPECIES: exodeoxyribonuclease I [Bradyrhizobium]|uniref:exodeoxyribonuclease I n=1 Tax=Bradyrhizobium TaxID=374 RepID=UPI000231C1BA|nr:exodeoxyribonuclease I [Bradyrhizobium japonicum]AJA59053.1 exodeoxyribonuclease I [Bradyrhizobium japonicum]KMJ94045.1 exodeoxyribonuclease I [Bradyrhizobium japonicum]MCS3536340.1 exodeoxyribonuclease-1 [Bradyrhizobium japonicum]MCS3987560.1 exodeoxyribonuclease-1 [Bradyrhizobium japonicum]MCS4017624.1 exodeoxyribonuclease-1 [Bradyrhizobium japonicum]